MQVKNEISAILVAAGVGQRYGGDKLLADIADVPVLVHSVRAFLLPEISELIIVTHPDKLDTYKKRVGDFITDGRLRFITGGGERWQSSLLGIQAAHGDIVAIHDAARPLITPAAIRQSLTVAADTGAALVAAPATDSIKIIQDGANTQSLERARVYLAQTPQTFRRELILEAYARAQAEHFQAMTDESELITRFLGRSVSVIPSTSRNLKITYPDDLAIARTLWSLDTH